MTHVFDFLVTKLSFLKEIMEQKLGREMLTIPYKGEGVPESVANIEKISKFGKTFEALTLETVKTFYKDAVAAKFKI